MTRLLRTRVRGVAVIAALAFVAAACGGNDAAAPTPTPAPTETPAAEAPEDEEEVLDHGFVNRDEVRIILGSAAGGGFDIQARILAPFLEEALEELTGLNLTVIVENVPGAAHRVATEQVNRSAPDGKTFIFSSAQLLVTNQLLVGADYDMRQMTPLASAGKSQRAIVVSKSMNLPQPTMAALIERSQTTPILFTHPGLQADLLLLKALLRESGVDFRVDDISLGSTSDQMASLLRRETEAAMTTTAGMAPFVQDNPNDIEFIVNLGCDREPAAPDTPTVIEQNVPNAAAICAAVGGDDRIFIGPPGIPADTLTLLDRAFEIALNSEGYLEQVRAARLVDVWSDASTVKSLVGVLMDTYERYKDELATS